MRKKITFFIGIVLCTVFFVTGCGKSSDTAKTENKIQFGLNQTVENKGLCEMSKLYSEVLDDNAKAQGWYYYYTDTDKSPAKQITWNPSNNNYTTAEVLFSVKNTSDKPQTFSNKITAKLFYQENDKDQVVTYDVTVFQQNPGQIDERGEVIMWSTKPVEIAVGESTNVSFRFDIPKDVYEKIYATANGNNTGIIETCEFRFDNGSTYTIDLTKALILASKSSSN